MREYGTFILSRSANGNLRRIPDSSSETIHMRQSCHRLHSTQERKILVRPPATATISRMIRSKWPMCLCRQAIAINISRILRNPHAFTASGQLSKNIEFIPWRYSTGVIAKQELQKQKHDQLQMSFRSTNSACCTDAHAWKKYVLAKNDGISWQKVYFL